MPTQSFKVGEMLNKRTKNTKTWINFDGSYTTEINSGDVHFEDESGNLQNINTDLMDEADFDSIDVPVAKEGKEKFKEAKEKAKADKKANKLNRDNYDFQGLFVPFETKIPRNFKKGYTIGKGQDKLTFKPVGASPAVGYINGQKNVIDYQDAWNDTDVTLEITPNGIKETMILKTDRAPFAFTFEVVGGITDELTAGTLKLSPAWLEDANKEKRDVSQTIRRDGEQTFIDLVADVEGLVYPIEIDPTVIIQPTNATAGKDSYVSSASSTTNYATIGSMGIGRNSSGDIFRSLIQFDLSSIPIGSVVTDAKLGLVVQNGSGTFPTISVHKVTQSWLENTVTWSNVPTYDTTILSSVADVPITPTALTFNGLSQIVNDFINGAIPNNGFLLKATDETVNNNRSLSSSDAGGANSPKLTITYNQPPTAPTVTAPNGGETWNSSHMVAWNPATDVEEIKTVLFNSGGTQYSYSPSKAFGQTYTIENTGRIKSVSFFPNNNVTLSYTLYVKNVVGNLPGSTILGSQVVSNKVLTAGQKFETVFDIPINVTAGQRVAFHVVIQTGNVAINGFNGDGYAGGNAFEGDSTGLTIDHWFEVIEGATTTQNLLKYQIQLTTDGTNWSDIVALTTAGATQYIYDFINKPQTSIAKIRIRAYDGSAYGPWDESNGVFSIIHNVAPTAPTNLTPVTVKDRALVTRFAWQHNDPNTDAQSKFDLDYRLQGFTTWINVTQNTINQYYDLPANTLPRGTIEWRVRTYDQSDLSGPYSELKTFLAGDKPATPTTLSPTDGSIVSVSNPTVEWSSVGQVGYNLKVVDVTELTTMWEVEQTSNNKAHTVGYSLENETDYVIQLTIRNTDGLSSDIEKSEIQVSYTPPAKAVVSTSKGEGIITLSIDNPVPVGTEPNVSYNSIFRRKQGETEFIRIETNIPTDGSFIDYTLASEQVYEYFVRTWGENETYNDSVIISASITLKGVWLHDVTNPSTIHNFKFDGGGRSQDLQVQANYMQFAGREKPVTEFGEHEHNSISVTLNMLKKSVDLNVLDSIIRAKNTLCYRDGRGRRIFGTATSLPTDDEFYGYEVDFKITECSFSEEV
jgi:hypothetical protein